MGKRAHGGTGRVAALLLLLLPPRALGRSPGHAGVRTVPDIRLQGPVRHLHQRRVRGQLRGRRDGKVRGKESEINPPTGRPGSPCSGPVWLRGCCTGSSARCSNGDQSRVKTGSVRLCRARSRRSASLLTLWVVWFMHLVAGVLRSSRNSGSFQWS